MTCMHIYIYYVCVCICAIQYCDVKYDNTLWCPLGGEEREREREINAF